jgi:hypothetical protein
MNKTIPKCTRSWKIFEGNTASLTGSAEELIQIRFHLLYIFAHFLICFGFPLYIIINSIHPKSPYQPHTSVNYHIIHPKSPYQPRTSVNYTYRPTQTTNRVITMPPRASAAARNFQTDPSFMLLYYAYTLKSDDGKPDWSTIKTKTGLSSVEAV